MVKALVLSLDTFGAVEQKTPCLNVVLDTSITVCRVITIKTLDLTVNVSHAWISGRIIY